ncbi:acyl-CoA thioesterase, partial [Chryseobacterium sp. HMWF028]
PLESVELKKLFQEPQESKKDKK